MVIYYFLLFTLCASKELFEDYYKKAEEFMKNMTFEEKVSQMLFPRFNYKNRTDDIKNKKPGGFVLFAYDFNYDETFIQDYINEIQNLSNASTGLPLGLAVDEEGGTVVRVSRYHRNESFPSPQKIYNESGNDGIAKIDKEKRELLRKFFLNVNLAPVADISYNSSDYIYDRTIGRGPKESAEYIEKDVEGYVNDNFTCCAKHFPGYGNNIDTHGDIAIDNRSYEQFQNEDFLTFEAAIRKEIPMILVSHNIVRCKDVKHPASLSKAWHDILRNELNYSGLILTDDLSMGAIKKYTDNVSEAVLAVNAGNDVLLTSDYYMHYNALIQAVKDGNITEDVVNKACRRIIAWKYKYLIPEEPDPTDPDPTDSDPTDSDPTDSDPTDSDPTDSDPTDSDPTDSDPTDSDPTDSDPTDSDPTDSDPTDSDHSSDSDSSQPEPEKNDPTTLIIVSIVLGVLIVGTLIVFLVIYLKNRKKKAGNDENAEEVLIKG